MLFPLYHILSIYISLTTVASAKWSESLWAMQVNISKFKEHKKKNIFIKSG